MATEEKLTVGQLADAVHQTKAAIKRAEVALSKLSELGARYPSAWASLADSTNKLRDKLISELDEFEKQIGEAEKSLKLK